MCVDLSGLHPEETQNISIGLSGAPSGSGFEILDLGPPTKWWHSLPTPPEPLQHQPKVRTHRHCFHRQSGSPTGSLRECAQSLWSPDRPPPTWDRVDFTSMTYRSLLLSTRSRSQRYHRPAIRQSGTTIRSRISASRGATTSCREIRGTTQLFKWCVNALGEHKFRRIGISYTSVLSCHT